MPKTFQVSIDSLEFDTIIGILPKERVTPQKVIFKISFEYNYDDIVKEFVNYAEVANLVESITCEKKFELLEEAIVYLENLLYKTYPIKNLKITLSKPNILDNCVVSVGN